MKWWSSVTEQGMTTTGCLKTAPRKLKQKHPYIFLPNPYFAFVWHEVSDTEHLEVLWTNFHLSPLGRLTADTFPVVPEHSSAIIFTIEVQTIEVWVITIFVPPGAFVRHGTVAWVGVIIPIFGGKCWATMITERITSRAWGKINWNIHS